MDRDDKNLSDNIIEIMFFKNAFEDNPLTEKFLSDQFHTSRTPIRDALKTLENDDIIERKKKKGVYLKRPSPKVIAELYDLRTVLEGFAIKNAIDNIDEGGLDTLQKHAETFTKAREEKDLIKAEKANRAFHADIVELSGNEMLKRMMSNADVIKRAFQYSYSLHPEKQNLDPPYAHEKIVKAMRLKDKEAAEDLLKKHILVGKKRMIEQALGFKMNPVH
jgi:DNA-binding GntR family transcriptional regulator